jgi:hypothetical protein
LLLKAYRILNAEKGTNRNLIERAINNEMAIAILSSWSSVELSFRIKFSFSRKLRGYELPSISKCHNVGFYYADDCSINNIKQNKQWQTKTELTDQELLDETKKMRSFSITNALIIGVLFGIIFYSIVKNSWECLH